MHFLFFLAFSLVHADGQWTCTLNTILKADVQHWRSTGHDAWSGQANLSCVLANLTEVKVVDITFNSDNVGIGAGLDSPAALPIYLVAVTSVVPGDLQLEVPVKAEFTSEGLEWRDERKLTVLTVNLGEVRNKPYVTSLTDGTLFIRDHK